MTCATLASLCAELQGSLPRYTSYPTAVELKPCTDTAPITTVLADLATHQAPLSLYVHLPYCPSLCYFCACNKVISQDPGVRAQYLTLLEQELEILRQRCGGRQRIIELHLGGGSPSYLEPAELTQLLDILEHSFSIHDAAQRSVEVDPRTFSADKARVLTERGFRRLSLGVQDLDSTVQEAINRIQPFELTANTIEYSRRLGFESVNIDLIYGLPLQTPEGFASTIDQVLTLRPQRVAMYGYAHVTWKSKVQTVFRNHPLPTPEQRIELLALGVERFEQAGYRYIGMDHFALPTDELAIAHQNGTLRRNFMGYTTIAGHGVLGVGVSSISDIHGWLFQNSHDLDDYSARVTQGQLPIARALQRNPDDTLRAFIIERLLCSDTLTLAQVTERFSNQPQAERIFSEGLTRLQPYQDRGLVQLTPQRITITPIGRFFLRHIAACFDAYLPAHSGKVFSQAV